MQALDDASRQFAQAVAACNPHVRFGPVAQPILDTMQRQLPLSKDLVNWYGRFAPLQEITIPQAGNDCAIYAAERLIERQIGYRWIQADPQRIADLWPANWIVIGDVGADPIIANAAAPGTPILQSWHGTGRWDVRPLAPGLAAYLQAWSVWVDVCLVGTGALNVNDDRVKVDASALWDEDDLLQAPVRAKLVSELAAVLPQECLPSWLA